MIHYAMMVRTSDGMPLSASIETDNDPVVRHAKRHIKVLAKQVKNVEDRCSLPLPGDSHVLNCTSAQGVSYIALCDSTYPVVLAFSFLDELVKEFITTYTARDVGVAHRPYSFIEFDRVVQKTRQRYNNPSSLATKINLSDLSLEIRLRPPRQVNLGAVPRLDGVAADRRLTNGALPAVSAAVDSFSCGLRQFKLLDIPAMVITALCASLNLIRGFVSLSQPRIEDISVDVANPLHGISFVTEAMFQSAQMYLMWKFTRRHLFWTLSTLVALILCQISLWDVRDSWQSLLHTLVAMFMSARSVQRSRPTKTPNYNV